MAQRPFRARRACRGRTLASRLSAATIFDLAEPVDVPVGQIQQRVDVGDAELVATAPGPHKRVTSLNQALGDDPEIKPGTVMGDQQTGHFRFAEAHTDPETRDPRLGDLEFGLADAVPVANADLSIAEPVDREVLPEVPRSQVVTPQVALPIVIRLRLVDHHGALFTTMPGEVALAIAVDVEPSDHDRSVKRGLPDAGVNGLALPLHVFGHTDVY